MESPRSTGAEHVKSLPADWLVPESTGFCSFGTETLFLVRLVFLIVSVKKSNRGVALESKDVRCDTVKEPPIMGNNKNTPGKLKKRIFKSPQCFDIKVV